MKTMKVTQAVLFPMIANYMKQQKTVAKAHGDNYLHLTFAYDTVSGVLTMTNPTHATPENTVRTKLEKVMTLSIHTDSNLFDLAMDLNAYMNRQLACSRIAEAAIYFEFGDEHVSVTSHADVSLPMLRAHFALLHQN